MNAPFVLPAIEIDHLRKVRLHRWEGLGTGSPVLVHECWVYFFQGDDGGPVKIGRTATWPGLRITELQCAYPFGWIRCVGLMRGAIPLEKELHRKFHHLRMRGEWFRLGADLRDFIISLPVPA